MERTPEDQSIYSRKFDLHQYFSPSSKNTKNYISYDKSTGLSMVHHSSEIRGDPSSLVVAVDGACPHNGTDKATKSTFGIYFGPNSPLNMYDTIRRPAGDRHTNNYAELYAVYVSLNLIRKSSLLNNWRPKEAKRFTAIIMTDSEYVYHSFTTWIWKWRANGFQSANGNPVANQDVIVEIDRAISALSLANIDVRFWSVPRDDNKGADMLANMALTDGPIEIQGDLIDRPQLLFRLYALQSFQVNPTSNYETYRGLHHLTTRPFAPLIDLIQPLVLCGQDTMENFYSVITTGCGCGSFWVAWTFIRLALYLVLESAVYIDLYKDGLTTSNTWQPIDASKYTFDGSSGCPRDFTADAVQDLKRLKEEQLYMDEETVNSLFNIMEGMKKSIRSVRQIQMERSPIVVIRLRNGTLRGGF